MYCEVYLDVFFAVNLLLDFLLLCLTNRMLRGTADPLRAFAGGVIGAVGMCLFLVLSADIRTGKRILFCGIMVVAMVRAGCGCRKIRALFLGVCIFLGETFLVGGLLAVLPYKIRRNVFLFSAITITTYWILYIGIRLCKYLKGKEPLLCHAVVALQGKKLEITGLYDTGNRLYDRETGKAVSVIEYSRLSCLLTGEQNKALERFCSMEADNNAPGETLEMLNPRFLLYTSVGCRQGLLPVITADSLTVSFQGKRIQEKKALIGLSVEALSLDGSYEMIISPAIWER